MTVLVTGAARGIGLATARRFLGAGWRVVLLDIDGEALARLDLEEGALPLTCDVADTDQVAEAMRAVSDWAGDLNALVNNAGIAVFKPILQTTLSEWARVMEVNLTGPFLMAQAALPLMRGGGTIVNIASISGQRASSLRVAYGTSKAGLMHLTKQQAVEFAPLGIRVNAVAPGPVDTAMAKAVHSAEIRAEYHETIPLARYGSEAEIAEAIWFLCSSGASYITGQILGVDGGFEAAGIGLASLRRADSD